MNSPCVARYARYISLVEGENSMLNKFLAVALLCLPTVLLTGCGQKEKVVDIQTPAGDVEVNRDSGDGSVEVDVSTDE